MRTSMCRECEFPSRSDSLSVVARLRLGHIMLRWAMVGVLPTPRIAPIANGEGDGQTQEILDTLGTQADSNFFRTLARHPQMLKRWIPFAHGLLHGLLPNRDRELLVLRAAHRSECLYEWTHHEDFAAETGLEPEEIARVRYGPEHCGWSAFDATLLRVADELVDSHTVSDSTWQMLAVRYDEQQLIEVPMVVGLYYSLGFTLNCLGVELES